MLLKLSPFEARYRIIVLCSALIAVVILARPNYFFLVINYVVSTPLMLTGPPTLASISPTVLVSGSGDKQDFF